MQTFGPVGEPGDGPQQAATSSSNANGEPVHFTMRTTGEWVKVSSDGDGNKSAARVDGMPNHTGWQNIQVGNELFQV